MAKTKYTKELLLNAISASISYSEVLRFLGLKTSGGNWRTIKRYLKQYEIEPKWLNCGHGWSKGQTIDTHRAVASSTKSKTIPDDQVFVENCQFPMGGTKLKKRLLRLGWKNECAIEECGLSVWLNKPICLHIDHINGNHNDNRFKNLRFICPNCHQQTETWGNTGNRNKNNNKNLKKQTTYKNVCRQCNNPTNNKNYCSKTCHELSQRKCVRPSLEILLNDVKETNFLQTGKKYGVSDNAIRKWIKQYQETLTTPEQVL